MLNCQMIACNNNFIVFKLYESENDFQGEICGYINIDEEVKKQNIRINKHGKLSLIVKAGRDSYEGAW